MNGGQREFYEAVANLFMKLQTPTVTELVNLGIKLEIILFQSRILCQFNSIFSEKSYIKSFLNKLWWVGPAVLPDSLEIAFFGTKINQKSGENH